MNDECICKGIGWIEQTEVQTRLVAELDEKTGKRYYSKMALELPVMVPCPRCKAKNKVPLEQKLNIPKNFYDVSFDNFETLDNPHLIHAKRLCKNFADNFDLPKRQNSLLLMGPSGSGKTHLAVAGLKRVAKRLNIQAKFYDFRDLLSLIRQSYRKGEFGADERVFSQLKNIPLLVIDELGSEKVTSWVMESLHRLIIPRYNSNLPTIFTTNYIDPLFLPKDCAEENSPYSTLNNQETLTERIGARLRSKLIEMCQCLYLDVNDFRYFFTNRQSEDYVAKSESSLPAIHQLRKAFKRLVQKSKEMYRDEAYRFHHALALEHEEAVAVWIYGRQRGIISPKLPLLIFINLYEKERN